MEVEYYVYVTDGDEEASERLGIDAPEKEFIYEKGYIDTSEVSNYWKAEKGNLTVFMKNGLSFTIRENKAFIDDFKYR